MAVKASAVITLSAVVDVSAVTRYYLLQSSTLARPSKPSSRNPTGGWTDTEPTYTSGSTNSLYFTDLTVFSDGTWSFSSVSLSTAYEAAKVAYNQAVAAQSTAANAQSSIDSLMVGERNLVLGTAEPLAFSCPNAFTLFSRYKQYHLSNLITDDPAAFLLSIKGKSLVFSYDISIPAAYSSGDSSLHRYGAYLSFQIKDNTAGTTYTWYGLHSNPGNPTNKHTVSYANPLNVVTVTTPGTAITVEGHYSHYVDPSSNINIKNFYNNPGNYTVTCSGYVYLELANCYFKGDVYIKNVKLSVGNTETDWCEAPEDTESAIQTVQSAADSAADSAATAQATADDAQEQAEANTRRIQRLDGSVSGLSTQFNVFTAGIEATIESHDEILSAMTFDASGLKVQMNGSIYYTLTDDIGYHIFQNDKEIASFSEGKGLMDRLQLGDIVARKTSRGGWVWTDA